MKKFLLPSLIICYLHDVSAVQAQSNYEPYLFTTLAGQAGAAGSTNGTNGAANLARFANPASVGVDSAGNVYAADFGNHAIRKISPARIVTTLAGKFVRPGSADGTGGAARFFGPSSAAIDTDGNIFVADYHNSTVRKVTPAGVVSTVAGMAGVPGSADGTGSAARFGNPTGAAVDNAGNLYVADGTNHTIRKITSDGVVTTLAGLTGNSGYSNGTGSAARFSYPQGMAVNSAGYIYVADTGNNAIRQITPDGVVTTFAGFFVPGSTDGTGTDARFNWPTDVAVDGAGNFYVSESSNHTIRKISPTGVVTTLAGLAGTYGVADGVGSAARFREPGGIAVDTFGTVYVADTNNQTIRIGRPASSSPTPAPTPTPTPTPSPTPTPNPTPSPIPTRVNGDGTINAPGGGQANFTIQDVKAGKGRKNKNNGSFSYGDLAAPLTFSTNKISNVSLTGSHASFSGKAKINGKRVTFTVDLMDNGGLGTQDTFSITVSDGYSASGGLTGGSITIE